MSTDPSFKMSQDYELIAPQKKRAYPILVEEWLHLKDKISAITDDANLYHTIGSILLGVAGSALVAASTLDLPKSEQGTMAMPLIIAWFICVTTVICGGLSLLFGGKQREIQSSSTQDVIQQMELIEKRYEVDET
jgi:hypothetical protein